MTNKTENHILTVGELREYLSIYADSLPTTIQLPDGSHVGITEATTAVLQPGTVLVFAATTIKSRLTGKKKEPVIVPKQ